MLLEKQTAKGTLLWVAEIRETNVWIRTGRSGTAGRTTMLEASTADGARALLEREVAARIADGFVVTEEAYAVSAAFVARAERGVVISKAAAAEAKEVANRERLTRLLARIQNETGLAANARDDDELDELEDRLAGMFRRYRPRGDGLEKLLDDDGVEGAVRARIANVCVATATGNPGDLYFVVRRREPIDMPVVLEHARAHLRDLVRLAEHVRDKRTSDALAIFAVKEPPAAPIARNERVASFVYECVADFLSHYRRSDHELFVLRKAVYSIANDHQLKAYVLWPVLQTFAKLPELFASYFELWRHGYALEFAADGSAYVADSIANATARRSP